MTKMDSRSQNAVKHGKPLHRQTPCPSYQLVNNELVIMQNKPSFQTEDRRQKTGDRMQKTVGRGQKREFLRKREIWAFWAKEGQFLQAFMQNKANLRKHQININIFSTKDYEEIAHLETRGKQTQSKPISKANQCCGKDKTGAVCVICFFIAPYSPLCYHSWQKKLSTVGRLHNEA